MQGNHSECRLRTAPVHAAWWRSASGQILTLSDSVNGRWHCELLAKEDFAPAGPHSMDVGTDGHAAAQRIIEAGSKVVPHQATTRWDGRAERSLAAGLHVRQLPLRPRASRQS